MTPNKGERPKAEYPQPQPPMPERKNAMLAVKERLPITAAEIHQFIKRVLSEVQDEIGPSCVTLSQPFWPDELAQSMLVRFEIPKFTGHRFRDADGNFIRKLDGFHLTMSHFVLRDTDHPGKEEDCWYILPFTTSQTRAASGGTYSQTMLPDCDHKGRNLDEISVYGVVRYLASLVQDDAEKAKKTR